MFSRRYKLAFASMGLKHLPAIAHAAGEGLLRPSIGRYAPFTEVLSALADAESGGRPAGRTVLTFPVPA
jgi:hypothetical protein